MHLPKQLATTRLHADAKTLVQPAPVHDEILSQHSWPRPPPGVRLLEVAELLHVLAGDDGHRHWVGHHIEQPQGRILEHGLQRSRSTIWTWSTDSGMCAVGFRFTERN